MRASNQEQQCEVSLRDGCGVLSRMRFHFQDTRARESRLIRNFHGWQQAGSDGAEFGVRQASGRAGERDLTRYLLLGSTLLSHAVHFRDGLS